jgi:hypothetical protein
MRSQTKELAKTMNTHLVFIISYKKPFVVVVFLVGSNNLLMFQACVVLIVHYLCALFIVYKKGVVDF